MQTGNIESKILEHLHELDQMLMAMTDGRMALAITPDSLALMQAKSIALVALSNTKAIRINTK